jgi:hypothetical protein
VALESKEEGLQAEGRRRQKAGWKKASSRKQATVNFLRLLLFFWW